MGRKMKYFSMFSGIGGFEKGIHNIIKDAECVGYSEIDKYASSVYQYNWKGHKNYGDATRIVPESIPDFDLLVGGFPCQAFSVAGRRQGFEDARGTLFFEIARILRVKRPKYLVLENVKGLLNHDSGNTFSTILGVLTDIGYICQWEVLNSKNFGVPQNRERVFIVGHLGGERRPEVFPIGEGNIVSKGQDSAEARQSQIYISPTLKNGTMKADNAFVVEKLKNVVDKDDTAFCMTSTMWKGIGNDGMTLIKETQSLPDACRIRTTDGCATTLKSEGGGMGAKTGLYAVVHNLQQRNPDRPSLTRICDCGSGKLYRKCHEVDGGSGQLSREDGVTYCLDGGNTQAVELGEGYSIRRLTPTECERLQGFPDGWTKIGLVDGKEVPISDSQRYKMCGNAVTTNVISAIMGRLFK